MDVGLRSSSIDIEIGWVPLVPITLNGTGPHTFLLETGAVGLSISPELAGSLGLSADPSAPRVLETVDIGGFRYHGVPVGLHDTAFAARLLGRPIAGYLGNLMLYVLGLAATVDYPGGRLVLTGPEEAAPLPIQGGPVPRTLDGGSIGLRRPCDDAVSCIPVEIAQGYTLVPAAVNGEGPCDFVLDTGAEACVVSDELAHSLGLAPDGVVATAQGYGEGKTCQHAAVNELRVGAAATRDLPIIVMDCADVSANAGRRIDGYIGYSFLRGFVLTLDYRSAG